MSMIPCPRNLPVSEEKWFLRVFGDFPGLQPLGACDDARFPDCVLLFPFFSP